MKIKTFKIPCHLVNGELVMEEDKATEMPMLTKSDLNESDIVKLASQIAQYNSDQIRESKVILNTTGNVKTGKQFKNQGDGTTFILRQILVES